MELGDQVGGPRRRKVVHNAGERITVRTHPDVRFHMDSLELIGRLEAGEATRQLSEEEVVFEEFKNPAGPKLMDRAQALIDGSLSAIGEAGFAFPGFLAFQLVSQGVASFQSVRVLVAAMQPVEATPSLGREADRGAPAGDHCGSGACGCHPCRGVARPRGAAIYRGLGAEMVMAMDLVNGTFGVLAQHITTDAAGLTSFRTALEPGPFTDLVSSAATIAITVQQHQAGDLLGVAGGVRHRVGPAGGVPDQHVGAVLAGLGEERVQVLGRLDAVPGARGLVAPALSGTVVGADPGGRRRRGR